MSATIKLSAPARRLFWEIPVLFEDDHLLAVDKPAGLLLSPDRQDPEQPSLMQLLHAGIAAGKPWARERGTGYLMNAHRLDLETSGALLLARSKPILVALADLFGSGQATTRQVALAQGAPAEDRFDIDAKLGADPVRPGLMRVEPRRGKRSRTRVQVLERFAGYTLVQCETLTNRPHQVRVHLRHAGLPIAGDGSYGGRVLLLSRLKPDYRLKAGHTERPLISSVALHAERLSLPHPATGEKLTIAAPWPKDLTVAVKYLRKYAPMAGGVAAVD